MKAFAQFKTETTVERNGVKLTLKPVIQEKGSKSSVPALLLSDFNLAAFTTWFAKPDPNLVSADPKVKAAAIELAGNKLNSFIADSVSAMIQQVWIDSGESYWIEYTSEKGKPVPQVTLTDELSKNLVESFVSNLQSKLNGETGAVKVRDAAWHYAEAKRVTSLFVKETDAKAKAELKLEALKLKKTADDLAKKEQDDILSLLN